ncbi:hypothetical protein RF11_00388 [Thelohanellus kitauei]|uniref:Uncharacterized protein n=1 Tax=Thelohanellus kitauei TaxID=669202 RepID=A0A0C2IMU1_THEKT|nr:hypothetical protein RF11_00388 [Thelohanellus kitauei]
MVLHFHKASIQEILLSHMDANIFAFDTLSVFGPHDKYHHFETKINYRRKFHLKFYLPKINRFNGFYYNDKYVTLIDGKSIRFICIDSTHIYEPETSMPSDSNSHALRQIDSTQQFP